MTLDLSSTTGLCHSLKESGAQSGAQILREGHSPFSRSAGWYRLGSIALNVSAYIRLDNDSS